MLDKFDLLVADYVDTGKIKYVVHPFYLGNPQMGLAAEAAWCAQDQGEYFDYQHVLYENQGQIDYSTNSLADLGESIGLDRAALASCISNRTHRTDVENARQAAAKRGVNSTPTFYINNQRVEGNQPYQNLQQIIEQELSLAQ